MHENSRKILISKNKQKHISGSNRLVIDTYWLLFNTHNEVYYKIQC